MRFQRNTPVARHLFLWQRPTFPAVYKSLHHRFQKVNSENVNDNTLRTDRHVWTDCKMHRSKARNTLHGGTGSRQCSSTQSHSHYHTMPSCSWNPQLSHRLCGRHRQKIRATKTGKSRLSTIRHEIIFHEIHGIFNFS